MIIVETKEEVESFLEVWKKEPAVVIPIWSDLERHPQNNSISFLYISLESESYVIPFEHNDCVSVSIDLSESTTGKWIWDKKSFLQSDIEMQGIYDIQSYSYFNNNELYPLESKLERITGFYTRLGIRDELGKIIPIMKFIEVLSEVAEEIKNLPKTENFGKNWVDDVVIPELAKVESIGVCINTDKFFDKWEPKYHAKHVVHGKVYTQYNPYVITSRPSNRHGGVNFSALNKDDGTREIFIASKNNILVQLDYDAYHIRIMAKIIGYDIPTESGHAWLAEQYGCSYEESKGRTFRNIYGGIEDTHIPFFGEIDKFIQTFWKNTQSSGFIQTPKRRIPLGFVESPNPQKVFNYLLQSMETELNMEILKKLNDSGHTPILYTYDSFLFDIPKDKKLVYSIKEIVESNGFPSKISVGTNYSEL